MTIYITTFLISLCLAVVTCVDPELEDEEVRGRAFIIHCNERNVEMHKRGAIADWAYITNLTEYNLKSRVTVDTEVASEKKQTWEEANKFRWKSFRNPDLRRQFKKYTFLDTNALPTKKFEKFSKIVSAMEKHYATAKICDYHNSSKCDLPLEPDINQRMAASRDANELKHLWVEWRKVIGSKMKEPYAKYVALLNEAARLNGFSDAGEMWLSDFETPDIKKQLKNLWEQVKPLYLQIHAYVRYKLRKKYGDIVSEKGPIPAHLLGNVWSQTWTQITDITLPYPNVETPGVTDEMVQQGYTPLKIFQTANDFFISLNLTAVPESFWKKSIFEKPSDGRELVCHASAFDLFDNDVRVKQCTKVVEEDFYTAHHEMGHIQYYLQYNKQAPIYRSGANGGFHEAVGDVVALSVSTPKHLQRLGLLKETKLDERAQINNLYKAGLAKIVFLPFGYIMDIWRWGVFSGKTTQENWNCAWWRLRHDYQGLEPPVDRTEHDFDPSCKYHTLANVEYMRYFVAFIIQFQFHRALCLKAGDYIPNSTKKLLHNCDIYQNTDAGNALGNMLQMGSSKPWQDAMEALTGQRNMDASGLLEYFKPLQTWLEEENKKNGVFIGWEPSQRTYCSRKGKHKNIKAAPSSSEEPSDP